MQINQACYNCKKKNEIRFHPPEPIPGVNAHLFDCPDIACPISKKMNGLSVSTKEMMRFKQGVYDG